MRDFILAGLRETYEITVDDPLTAILGLEAFRDRPNRRTRLRQRGSMDDMLNEFLPGWRDMKPEDLPDSPMQERHVLGKKELALDAQLCTPAEITTYNRKEGCLNWLTYTGPDFIFATRHCSRFLKAPTLLNMHEIDRIIRCWARIRLEDEDGLWLGGKEGVQIISTVDSSYHSFPDMKSGTGGTLHMSHDTGSFMSLCDKQSITTDSAMACEGVGGHLQIRKLLPLRYFCQELGFPQLLPSKFYMDNESFINTITGQRGCSDRSKHMLIRYKVLEEAWKYDEVDILHLDTFNMVSNILTKPLGPTGWRRLRRPLLGTAPIDTTPVVKLPAATKAG